MEDTRSVNSPRRFLSFSKNRRATVSFPDPDDKPAAVIGVSGDHGPKSSEVYGFVGSISTVVATGFSLTRKLYESYTRVKFLTYLFVCSCVHCMGICS